MHLSRRILALAVIVSLALFGCTASKPAPKTEPTPAPAAKEAKAKESPILTKLVADGKLPKLEERLPKEPLVLKGAEGIGVYGGTWRTAMKGAADAYLLDRIMGYENYVRWSEDWSKIEPNIMSKWEGSPDAKIYKFTIREGLKWSDGKPFTADDIIFWYEDVLMYTDLTKALPGFLNPGGKGVKVTKIDARTVQFAFEVPNGLFLQNLCTGPALLARMYRPAHYLKTVHPKYNQAAVDAKMKELGSKDLIAYWDVVASPWFNPELPTLNAWIVKSPMGKNDKVTLERNPYYWKVDTEGNQLPYIDYFQSEIHQDTNTMVLKILAGEIDMQDRHIATLSNKSVFADGAQKGNFRLHPMVMTSMNTAVISFNLNQKDPVLRELFQNKNFRIAVSHAIDRKKIIDTVFVSQGEPWQVAPRREEAKYFDEQMAKQYEFDTAKANQLLDQILPKKGANGMRLRPDGKPLSITLELVNGMGDGWADVAELVKKNWAAAGIDMNFKIEDRALWDKRKDSGEMEVTFWVGDGGVGFTLEPRYYMPFYGNTEWAPLWGYWFATNGKQGEEPSAPAKKQMDLYRQLEQTSDLAKQDQLMKDILKIAKDEFWAMGISLPAQGYGIAKNDLKGVPKTMFNSWTWPHPGASQTSTYYFKK